MPEKDTALRRWGGRLVLWVLLLYAALVAFYLMVFRLQVKRLNDGVCLLNKRVFNPMMMFLDRRHWYAAVLRHKGRHSGKEYATPVTAEQTEDGYVIPLAFTERTSTGSRTSGWPDDAPSRPGTVPARSVSPR